MTKAEAAEFAWVVAVPMVQFLGLVAVFLLGLAIIGEIRR